ncbi:MAG: sulfatase [Saprospiraceae bacterium]|nr:sulfatase [Saprospiraceae bacterium]
MFSYVLPFVFAITLCLSATQAQSPNIIIIFTDDLGYGDLGVYGHPTIATPNLDQMAREGLKFSQFYSGASVCTPSRAALLTGRLPIRYGMVSSTVRVLFPFSLSGLPSAEITLAEALKSAGYKTGIVGKWHLGHKRPFLPLQHGFDSYFGIPYSNDMLKNPEAKWGAARNYPSMILVEGNDIVEKEVDQRNLTKRYTSKAIDFIKDRGEEPFFLYMPHTFPHVPLFASKDFEGTSTAGIYGDVVEELDWSVGQILKTLKEEDIAENTLVFFTSDNGPWLVKKAEGGSAGLLREGKGSTWEGGMREPAIAWWPGTIEGGQTTQQMATTMDIYATALDLAGVSLPSDRAMDGKSMRPIFDSNQSIRDVVYFYLGAELFAIRVGKWKMHYKTLTPYVGEKPETHDPPLLFNLDIDPSEKRNLSVEHPDVITEINKVAHAHLNSFVPPPSELEKLDTMLISGSKKYDF